MGKPKRDGRGPGVLLDDLHLAPVRAPADDAVSARAVAAPAGNAAQLRLQAGEHLFRHVPADADDQVAVAVGLLDEGLDVVER